MKTTSFDQFVELAKHGTFVPVCHEVMADLLTPVSAFLKVAERADNAFLLESVEGGERVARYSFLGKDPFLVIRARDHQTVIEHASSLEERDAPFLVTLRDVMAQYQSPVVPGLPRFTGGAVGFLGYEAAAWFEPSLRQAWKRHGKSVAETDETGGFMLFDTVLAFDHVKHRILIIAYAPIEKSCNLRAQYELALAKIRFIERELERTLSRPGSDSSTPLEITSNTTRQDFEAAVIKAKEHITAGDVYQVVLSQRFEANVSVEPFTVYRALRYVNPSPYMYFIRMGGISIVGSSPEMLVRVEGQRAETHPIAGTRPRGQTEEEDLELAEELKQNEKERAEHVMLVDLGRNDLGRVCEFGTVQIPQFMGLERYSHVMHLVSRVEGKLAVGKDRLEALVACFPAGTVSGAPKIRAMELIAELEPTTRGIYAGAIGYLDFSGHLDCCITIRTIAIKNGKAYVQAGAGIVADSDPSAEYQETCDKASALLRALEIAHEGRGPVKTDQG